MAAKRKTSGASSGISGEARAAAGGADTRDRVRKLTVDALRGGLSRDKVSAVVHDVLHGASEAVDNAVPASRESVLRRVFEGLGDAVDAVADAGAKTAKSAQQRGRAVAAANEDLLHAVSGFADRASSEVGDELRELVERAKRTGGKVGESARGAARAADGRLVELTGETARAGMSVARRAAGEISMAASGLLEGLGQVMMPRKAAMKKAPAKKTAGKKTAKKTAARKTAARKTAAKKTAVKRGPAQKTASKSKARRR